MNSTKNILIRLPNWVGDLVMSSAFVAALRKQEAQANIEVIVKKQLVPLAELIPGINTIHAFDKKLHRGLGGAIGFGKALKQKKVYHSFYCLPNSFSSAAMAFFTGAKERIGYRNELRSSMLTRNARVPANLHRVEEYLHLLELRYRSKVPTTLPQLQLAAAGERSTAIVLNFNSEAQSRRMPVETAVTITQAIASSLPNPLVLVGGPGDAAHTQAIEKQCNLGDRVTNVAGKTSLPELAETLGHAAVVVSTDSGPAHLANALSTPTIVCFSAGNEANTRPYNANKLVVLRSSTPCQCEVRNTCKLGTPPCLQDLNSQHIVKELMQWMQK